MSTPRPSDYSGHGSARPVPVPDLTSLSFEDAVRLFKEWGFAVEPGPRPEQVTLILEGADSRHYGVHDAHALPAMAATAFQIRWQNAILTRWREYLGGNHRHANHAFDESAGEKTTGGENQIL